MKQSDFVWAQNLKMEGDKQYHLWNLPTKYRIKGL